MIERVPYYGWPKPTPTNAERIEAWRRKYQLVPIELQCAPIRKPVLFDFDKSLIDLADPNEPDIPTYEGKPGTTYTKEF